MKKIETPFLGLYVLETENFQDNRGNFQKIFTSDFFQKNKLDYCFKEFYYSVNKKDVLRGMHFQLPPFDHTKVVYVSYGKIIDVVVDIRKGSPTFCKCFSIELDNQNARYMYIPKGFAHGFIAMKDNSVVNYAQTSCYSEDHDCGVDAMSINFDWGVKDPIRSGRDLAFDILQKFNSPF